MFDTVNFRLGSVEAGNVCFLQETACYLDDVAFHEFGGVPSITANLGGLKVFANKHTLKIKDGSVCKWYLGDNFKTMTRGDMQRAVESLSDILHVPINKATITRLDVAQNIITNHPAQVYFNHLGGLRYAKRLCNAESLYYKRPHQVLCFYDKMQEARDTRTPIPELYAGRGVLRFEQRYMSNLPKLLGVNIVTGALLYDEAFYTSLVKRWYDAYKAIQKINDITANFEAMKTKKDLSRFGVLAMVERAGGELQMIEQINEARAVGTITKKQAFDLRQAVKEACKLKEKITAPSKAISELDKKMLEAVRYYR